VRLRRRHHAKRQQRAEDIEADDRDIGRSHAEGGEQAGTAQCTRDARGIHRGSRNADRADQLIRRHDGRDQGAAHAKVGRPHEAHDRHDDQDIKRTQIARQRQRHQRGSQHRKGRAHHGEQIAMTDAVTHHAEHRRDQSADEIERREDRQQQHRSGLDQHIPAENERLHLEGPRGEQIGRPLESVIPDAEGSERGRPRGPAQNSMPRFIAFHPALFLIVRESGFPGAGTYSQQRDTALLFPMSITPRSSRSD
jgi:hypothetical protein